MSNLSFPKLKLLIVDDEKNVREAIAHMVCNFMTGYELVGACADTSSAVKLINNFHPDIVLLDIELGNDNAFSLFEYFPNPEFKVIFITGYQQYAVKAFRFSAVDYLLKPVDPDLLEIALNKAKDIIHNERLTFKIDVLLQNLSGSDKKSKRIVLKTADKIHIVNLEDVMYCEANRGYTTFNLADKSNIVVSNTLGEYEELFNEFGFIRIHQSYLLNLSYLKRYDKSDGGSVILKDNTRVPVATRKKELLFEAISKM